MENFLKGLLFGSLVATFTTAGLMTGMWIPVAIMWGLILLGGSLLFGLLWLTNPNNSGTNHK